MTSASKPRHLWAFVFVVFMSAMLRPALSGIGPILENIQRDLSLSSAQLGLLTSLPVLCFGVGAFAAPVMVRRLGLGNSFMLLLAMLVTLLATRPWFGFGYLLVASILAALAIAICNVLFPTLIRVEFPSNVARMTAVYTTLLSAFAALASAVAVPLAASLGGWRPSVAIWAVPGVLAIVAWGITVRHDHPVAPLATGEKNRISVWRKSLTWSLAAFFGLQSANFYVMLSWLPTILVSQGMGTAEAGGTLGYLSIVGVPVGLIVTANLRRFKSLTPVILGISVLTAGGMLLISLGGAAVLIGATLAGFGLASSFPLALALIALKATGQDATTQLSAVSQGFGYLVAAITVYAASWAHDATSNWNVALYGVAAFAVAQAAAGIYATRQHSL